MSHKHYKQIQIWEKQNLEKLIDKKPTIQPIYSATPEGWKITKYKFLVNIKYLATELHRERKTIKNELIRGSYQTLTNDVSKNCVTFSYSTEASDRYHKIIVNNKKFEQTKISKFPKLRNFIFKELETKNQSLGGIAGRSKLLYDYGELDACIEPKTLYNYIDNDRVPEIDKSCLKRKRKRGYRHHEPAKRINGESIDKRPEIINQRLEFGHWEIDLIEGKRKTNTNLLTMRERIAKWGLAVKIFGKRSKTITDALRNLQEQGILDFGWNIKSITTDNGSEFWDWKEFKKSIFNRKNDIEVYFCHPHCPHEKGGIENFNMQMRIAFPKGTDFTNISQDEINKHVNNINNLYRGSLGYKTANEMYNKYTRTKWEL